MQAFYCKWHAVAWTLTVVDYVREAAGSKSGKYGEYGSFEYLLFFYFPLL